MDDASALRPPSPPPTNRPSPVRVRRATVSRPAAPSLRSSSPVAPLPNETTHELGPSADERRGSLPRTRRRGATITERLFSGDVYEALPEGRRGSLVEGTTQPRSRRATLALGATGAPRFGSDRGSIAAGSETEHDEQETDVLDVLDSSVATTSHLVNIQSAFFPSFLARPTMLDLPPATPPLVDSTTITPPSEEEGEEEEDPLDQHLRKLVRNQKRKQKLQLALRGVWAFLKTPLGVAVGIYGFMVVFWGAGLVFVLIIPFQSDYVKKLWIEIASQVLTALFTITGIGMLPWRIIDTYYISIIYSYARRTRERRAKLGLPPLENMNDLPDPEPVLPGGGLESECRPAVGEGTLKEETEGDIELGRVGSPVEEAHHLPSNEQSNVLTPSESLRLHSAQIKFAASQSWYRPHGTFTHHAFPIGQALLICVLIDLNSFFQALLCGVMWGYAPHYYDRPAWTTATFIVGSFGCGLAAAVVIGVAGEKTKKKKEVTRRVWKLLKEDEERMEHDLKLRKERKEREKEGGKKHLAAVEGKGVK